MKTNFLHRPRFPLLLATMTFLVSILIALSLWKNAINAAERNLQAEFDFLTQETADQIERRMGTYEQVLRGTAGFLRGSTRVSREDYRAYVSALSLEEHFPGIQAIGIAEAINPERKELHALSVRAEGFPQYEMWPEGEREFYTPITKIEPFNQMNRRAFGYDMFSEPVRRAAMVAARDSGKAVLSGKVTLVQEERVNVQPGFLMYFPIYARGQPIGTVEERRAALLGWAYAPFRAADFLKGLRGLRATDLDISLYDGNVISEQTCLFGCTASDSETALLQATRAITIGERPWTLNIRSTPVFEARVRSHTPRVIAAGGIVISVLLTWVVWILAAGRSRAMALATRMTEDLRESHDNIAAEQRRIQSILQNSLDAFVAIDKNGVVTDWNAAAERIFGWKGTEAIGRNVGALIIPSDQRAAHDAGFSRFMATGTGPLINRHIEVVAQRRDGSLVPVELALAAMESHSGHTAHAFIRDLTERKAGQHREAERQKALDEARSALHHAQRLEAVGKLTGGVAHDFNNLLQVISGNVQLLLHGSNGNRPLEHRLEAVMQAVDRGAKLSSQLLSFARRQPLQPRVVNLSELLRSVENLLPQAIGEEIDVETVVSSGLWNTMVDPSQMENVFLNLVINARDAMNGRGKLTIELGNAMLDDEYVSAFADVEAGQYVMLAISDTGTGMSADVIEQAFEPFFTTKPQGEGTGLGLSMAYGFVKQSNGHIRIYSEVGHGTTIKLYLPRSYEVEANKSLGPADTAAGGDETVLVVEDDLSVQATVTATLKDLGYVVLTANDGESAIEVLQSGQHIDLVFTDVVMPGPVSSTEVARAAKSLFPHVAVLFTSGYTQNAIVHGGRLDPGVHLLSKPYRREELARKVRQVLGLAPESPRV